MISRFLALAAICVLAVAQIPMGIVGDSGAVCCSFYVDPSGSDAANGLTPATAFQTVAKINGLTLTPGQSVGFKRGGTWRETLTPGQSGTAGSPITFTAYGSGAAPSINGANLVTGWMTSPATWTEVWNIQTQSGSSTWSDLGTTNNTNVRNYVKGASITASATIIRVLFHPSPTSGHATVFDAITIGPKKASADPYDFTATPTALTFGGVAGLSLTGAGANVYSDPFTFTLTTGVDYLVAEHISSGSPGYLAPGAGLNAWSLVAANDTATVDTTGYTSVGGGRTASVYTIESAATFTTNVYQAGVATQPYIVAVDGVVGAAKGSVGALASNGDWFWSANTLYLYSTSDPAGHTVEASARANGISGTTNYITISNLDIRYPTTRGINTTGTNWTMQGNYIHDLGGTSNMAAVLLSGANANFSSNTINRVIGTGGVLVGVDVNAANVIIANNDIENVWNLLEYPSGLGNGITTASATGAIITGNKLISNYRGINDASSSDSLMAYNVVVNSHVNGIEHGPGVSGHPGLIYNNTIIHNPSAAAGHCLTAEVSGGYYVAKNNLCYTNFTGTNTNVELHAIDSATYTSIDIDYNLYYLAPGTTSTTGELISTQYTTLANWQTALAGTSYSGKDAHSLNGDPLFTNFAGGDFTLQAGSPAIGAGTFIAGVSTANPPNIGAR